MPVPSALERIGNVLAERYVLDELLARGGMGVLYLGRHLLTGRRVAVKVMRPDDDAVDPTEAARFLREAQAAAALEHPHVVQVFDMGVDQGAWFLVMELLEGESLAAHLKREGPLAPGQALEWLLPVMGALATAHAQGVVHRDVKPENIFLARRGPRIVPTLLDFGIAKQAEAATLTERGMAIGTPMFMSPEQVRGEGVVGPQTDVWSMGVVFHFCLTDRPPFDGRTPANVLVKILSEPAPRLTEVAPSLPVGLATAIDRALEPDCARRHADMRAFACALVGGAAGRIPLPHDPEPIGLPDYNAWLGDPSAPLPLAAPAAPPPSLSLRDTPTGPPADAEPEPPSRSGTRRSSNPPSAFPLRPGHWLWIALACASLAAGALFGWLQFRTASAPVVAPAPAPPPTLEQVDRPAAPVPTPDPPSAGAPAGVGADLAPAAQQGAAEAKKPAQEPTKRERTARRKRRRPAVVKARSGAAREPSRPLPAPEAPAPAPPAPAALDSTDDASDDPFRIRRDYKSP